MLTLLSRSTGSCPQVTGVDPTLAFILQDDSQNNVRMFDVPNGKDIYAFPEFKSDTFKACLNSEANACVSSFYSYSGLDISDHLNQQARLRISQLVTSGNWAGLLDILLTSYRDREAMNAIPSADISFNEANFGSSYLNILSEVEFNTCLPALGAQSAPDDFGYKAYGVAVHETGHALGLSGFSVRDLIYFAASTAVNELPFPAPFVNLIQLINEAEPQHYIAAHPTIPDSVMNYDSFDATKRSTPYIRHPRVVHGFAEPDCSPHPFDVLAVFALYQTQ